MKLAIIGMGLIGGSLARTIKLHTEHTVYGCDVNSETLSQARLLGAMDDELDDEKLRECDMTLVTLYPAGIVDWIRSHAHLFRPGSLVIDCGGVKQSVCGALLPLAQGQAWHFIGGHPMAGREFSGFKYAQDDLFDNASMILCTMGDDDLDLMQTARNFFLDIGFRRVQFATPQQHDEMIAYTSQLAHIVSSAYVKCPLAQTHRGFSAGSFADMTRVARLNEGMWTELFLNNQDALLPVVDNLIEELTHYRDALRDEDAPRMQQLLREGREIKEKLSN